jgi:hypothetical protein
MNCPKCGSQLPASIAVCPNCGAWISDPQSRLQEEMKKFLEPQSLIAEEMKKLRDPQSRLQEEIKKFLEPQSLIAEQIKKLHDPQSRLQEEIKGLFQPQLVLNQEISKYLHSLTGYLSDPLIGSVFVDDSGSVVVGNETVSVDAITKQVEKLATSSNAGAEFIHALFEWLERINAATRVFVIYLVLPYILAIIANLTTPIYEDWWKSIPISEPRVARKQIVEAANELYQRHELHDYRFVSARILHVRESARQSSAVVDELYFGKTVKLIEKSKRWSFVEYYDQDTNIAKRGWVFSRYLAKFQK